MLLLTLFLIVAAPLLVELLLGRVVPTLWHRPRWVVLPAGAAVLGWWQPFAVFPGLPHGDHVLTALLGIALALLVCTYGHFRTRFWSAPSEEDLARTGRRSALTQARGR